VSVIYTVLPPWDNEYGLDARQVEADTVPQAVAAWAGQMDADLRGWVERGWRLAEHRKVGKLDGVWEVPGTAGPLLVVRTAKPPKPKEEKKK